MSKGFPPYPPNVSTRQRGHGARSDPLSAKPYCVANNLQITELNLSPVFSRLGTQILTLTVTGLLSSAGVFVRSISVRSLSTSA